MIEVQKPRNCYYLGYILILSSHLLLYLSSGLTHLGLRSFEFLICCVYILLELLIYRAVKLLDVNNDRKCDL
jgi:hypothetical protein